RVESGGTYWVQYQKHCTVYIDTFKVNFPNTLPALDIQASCHGQHNGGATLHTDNDGYLYYWLSLGGDTLSHSKALQQVPGGHYTVRIVTPDGCDTQLAVEIPEEQYTAAFFADSIVCQNATFEFINNSDNYFTEFQWDFGDGSTTAQQHPTHHYAHPGSYTSRLVALGEICRDTVS